MKHVLIYVRNLTQRAAVNHFGKLGYCPRTDILVISKATGEQLENVSIVNIWSGAEVNFNAAPALDSKGLRVKYLLLEETNKRAVFIDVMRTATLDCNLAKYQWESLISL